MSFGIPVRNGLAIGLLSSTTLSSNGGLFPAMALDFLQPFLDSRITFSRGSNATLVDSTGKITYAPANLLLQSQDFDTANWTKARTTVAANATVAPDGTSTADKLVEDTTASSTHFTAQSANYTAGTTYTLSVSVKAAERNWFDIQIPAAIMGTIRNAFFDVSNGTVGTVTSGITAAIVSIGNGWYRCSVTFTPTASAGTGSAFLLANADNSISYTGDGTSGLFLWGAQLEQVTYQTTPSTYVATTTAAYYGPRFDYDPVTLAPKGLLIEEARTNLLTYSEQFDNAAWTKVATTATANATAAPDGTTNAEKLAETATTTTHYVVQTATTTAVSHSFSCYIKAAERSFVLLWNSTANFGRVFNLGNGTVSGTVAGVVQATAEIVNAGNGWYRCTIYGTCTAAANEFRIYIMTDATTFSFAGVAGSGVYLYGAQLEAGAFATSYIPTVASTVTRSADVATMTGTNFSSWYNQSEGTFVTAVSATAGSARALTASAGAVTNQLWLQGGAAAEAAFQVYTAGAFVAQLALLGSTASKVIAGAYKVNDFAATIDGGTVATDTSGGIGTFDRLNIGARFDGTAGFLNGHIRQLAYYNTRLPNSQLQTLTAPSLATTLSLSFTNQAYTVGV